MKSYLEMYTHRPLQCTPEKAGRWSGRGGQTHLTLPASLERSSPVTGLFFVHSMAGSRGGSWGVRLSSTLVNTGPTRDRSQQIVSASFPVTRLTSLGDNPSFPSPRLLLALPWRGPSKKLTQAPWPGTSPSRPWAPPNRAEQRKQKPGCRGLSSECLQPGRNPALV